MQEQSLLLPFGYPWLTAWCLPHPLVGIYGVSLSSLEDKPLLYPAECQLGHTVPHHQWEGSCMPECCHIALRCWERKGKLRVMLCQDSLAMTGFCWLLSLICFYFLYLPFQSSFYLSLLSFCQPTFSPVSSLSLWLFWHWEGGGKSDHFLQNPLALPPDISVFSILSAWLSSCPTGRNPSLPVFPAPGSLLHSCISCWQSTTVHTLGCENTAHSHPQHGAGSWRAAEVNMDVLESFSAVTGADVPLCVASVLWDAWQGDSSACLRVPSAHQASASLRGHWQRRQEASEKGFPWHRGNSLSDCASCFLHTHSLTLFHHTMESSLWHFKELAWSLL